MKPTLGQIVFYVPLSNEPAQSFVSAAFGPTGEAVVAPLPYPDGFRAATVVGLAGKSPEAHAALLIYKRPGDPARGEWDALLQRLGDVPYSAHGIPGTWMYEQDAQALPHRGAAADSRAVKISDAGARKAK